MLTKSGKRLDEVIRKAIDDHQITSTEYEEIINLAQDDGHIDAHEKVLLAELHKMIRNKSVTRVPG
jgi:hypothetical protein